jgi:hypothetical protein
MSTPFRFKNADNTTVDFEDYYVRADYFRSGNLWNWGSNSYGQLGDNTAVSKSSPVQTIAWGSNWKQISSGYSHTAAIKTDGTLWTWGKNNYGQLGDNTLVRKSSPVQTVAGGTNWKQVVAGSSNTLAIKTDGTLWTWGYNLSGVLGDNTTSSKSSPVQTIAGGTNWMQIAYSGSAAAIKTDGTLWVWGGNDYAQLGDNTLVNKSSPVQTVAFGTNWKQVSGSARNMAAIKTDGTLWTWGFGLNGQLGMWDDPYAGTSPVTVSGSKTNFNTFTTSNTTGVSVGMGVYTSTQPVTWSTVSAISTNVSITFNGFDFSGNWTGTISLGVGATKGGISSKSSPVQTVAFGTNWKQVSCGYLTTTAIKQDGTLWVWGYNNYGGLGDNTIVGKSSPIQTVAGGTNWKQVSASRYLTAAIKTDGTLWLWGRNAYNNIGDNTSIFRSSPVQTIAGGTNWKQVAGIYSSTAAIQYQDDYQ